MSKKRQNSLHAVYMIITNITSKSHSFNLLFGLRNSRKKN